MLERLEVWIIGKRAWVAKAEKDIEGLAVLRHGNDNKTVLDLFRARLRRLGDIEQCFEERGCKGEEELEDAEINFVRRTQDYIRLCMIKWRGSIGRVDGHYRRHLEANVIDWCSSATR